MKILEYDARRGSYLSLEKILGTPTNTSFFRSTKGYTVVLEAGKSVTWTIPSSTITNIISHVGGNGTIRISCDANNTDIAVTNWTNTNTTVSYSSITTITVTATSGRVYLSGLFIYNVITINRINELYKEFLRATAIEKPKRNFTYPKPTDLSSEKDNTLGVNITDNYDFTDSWTGVTTTEITQNSFTTTGTGGLFKGITTQGKRYKVYMKGTKTGSNVSLANWTSITEGSTSSSDNSFEISFVGTKSVNGNLYITTNIGTVTITELIVQEVSGLVAAYNMIPNGNTLVDISGNGNNGTIYGALSTKDGLSFNNKGYVDLGSSNAVNIGKTFSVSWRGTVNNPLNDMVIYGGNYIRVSSLTTLTTFFGSSADNLIIPALKNNEEYTFTVTRNEQEVKWYINGSYAGGYTSTANDDLIYKLIGCVNLSTQLYSGVINDLRIMSYAFTPEQAKAYHNSFVKTYINETMENHPVGDTNPKGWIAGTGAYTIEEVDYDI